MAELAQSLAEKNKELETIVYIASHDLRSPLVNIQGFTKELQRSCDRMRTLLEQGNWDENKTEFAAIINCDIVEFMGFIQSGVHKINMLLNGFLRFSRLGRAALRIERLNMNAMLARIARTIEFQIKQAGAILRVEPLPDCLGDASQINQVFTNLFDNALKYREPARPPAIDVRGKVEGKHCVYSVADNGIGIAAQHQGKIFRFSTV